MDRETAVALLAQQDMMQQSIGEAVREMQEQAWEEGHEAGRRDAINSMGGSAAEETINPYSPHEYVEES